MATLMAPRTPGVFPRIFGRTFISVRNSVSCTGVLSNNLWRVVNPDGAVIGYIEEHAGDDGVRYSVRYVVFATRTRELGVFTRIDDAADCFR